jgi:hypothetical protein
MSTAQSQRPRSPSQCANPLDTQCVQKGCSLNRAFAPLSFTLHEVGKGMFWLPGHSNRTRECFCCPQYRVFYCFADLAKFSSSLPFSIGLEMDWDPSGNPPRAPRHPSRGRRLRAFDAGCARATQVWLSGFLSTARGITDNCLVCLGQGKRPLCVWRAGKVLGRLRMPSIGGSLTLGRRFHTGEGCARTKVAHGRRLRGLSLDLAQVWSRFLGINFR